MNPILDYRRMRIYLGEDKRHGDRPLYQAIVRKAHEMRLAGLTVFRGSHGFGHSTRMHSADVLFSEDLPLVVEIVETAERLETLRALLARIEGIGLVTLEPVEILLPPPNFSDEEAIL